LLRDVPDVAAAARREGFLSKWLRTKNCIWTYRWYQPSA